MHVSWSEIAPRVYTRDGLSDSRTTVRAPSAKNLVPRVHAGRLFWHTTCLSRVGRLSSVGKHVPRVHTGRRFLHRTASLSIRPSALRATTTTTGNRLAKNGTGGPPSGQAVPSCMQGPWISISGFFPTESRIAEWVPPRSSHWQRNPVVCTSVWLLQLCDASASRYPSCLFIISATMAADSRSECSWHPAKGPDWPEVSAHIPLPRGGIRLVIHHLCNHGSEHPKSAHIEAAAIDGKRTAGETLRTSAHTRELPPWFELVRPANWAELYRRRPPIRTRLRQGRRAEGAPLAGSPPIHPVLRPDLRTREMRPGLHVLVRGQVLPTMKPRSFGGWSLSGRDHRAWPLGTASLSGHPPNPFRS